MKRVLVACGVAAVLAAAAGVTLARPYWAAPDDVRAQAWLKRAADARDAGAEGQLARWTDRGNAPALHAYVALLAHRGDAASRRRLADVLAHGAQAGDALAATQLADLLLHDPAATDAARAQARRLVAQGAAGGVAEARRMLATFALNDAASGAAERTHAATLLAQAADQGDAPAMFLLANLLRAGQGVPRDDARALALYQRAADADYAPASQALALAYRYGELGLEADASQSRLMDHEAAEALSHEATRTASALTH